MCGVSSLCVNLLEIEIYLNTTDKGAYVLLYIKHKVLVYVSTKTYNERY